MSNWQRALVFVLVLGSAAHAASQAYTITSLGTLPGCHECELEMRMVRDEADQLGSHVTARTDQSDRLTHARRALPEDWSSLPAIRTR